MSDRLGDAQHVVGPHAGGDERLVGVAQRRVGDEQAFLGKDPLRKFLGAKLEKQIAAALRHHRVMLDHKRVGHIRLGQCRGGLPTLGGGVAVDGDVGKVRQRACRAVAARTETEQLGLGIDELGVGLTAAEGFIRNDIFQKRDVGLHAADAEFTQRTVHALAGHREITAHRGDLHQHRVVEWRDHRAGVARSGIEANAKTGSRAVVENTAVIGREIFLGILGGDAALDRESIARDLFLRRDGHLGTEERLAAGDENLRTHKVDAGDAFGDGVLDLDARVHLDEEPVVLVHVVEELDGARIVVADAFGEIHRSVAKLLAYLRIEVHRRRDLDDFLITALHRAIALV